MTISTHKQAEALCLKANLRPYCKKIYFWIYDMQDLRGDGDCNYSREYILQDAVTALLSIDSSFKKTPNITHKYVYSMAYYPKNFRNAINVTDAKGNKYKIETSVESTNVRKWDDLIEYLKDDNRIIEALIP